MAQKRSFAETQEEGSSTNDGYCWRKLFTNVKRVPRLGAWPTIQDLREAGAMNCQLALIEVCQGKVYCHVVKADGDFELYDSETPTEFRVGGRKYMLASVAKRLRQREQRREQMVQTDRRARKFRIRNFQPKALPQQSEKPKTRERKWVSLRLRDRRVQDHEKGYYKARRVEAELFFRIHRASPLVQENILDKASLIKVGKVFDVQYGRAKVRVTRKEPVWLNERIVYRLVHAGDWERIEQEYFVESLERQHYPRNSNFVTSTRFIKNDEAWRREVPSPVGNRPRSRPKRRFYVHDFYTKRSFEISF